MRFYVADREAREIAISVFAIAIALAVANVGIAGLLSQPGAAVFLISFFLATVGIGFIFHELAHKVVANFFGAAAEFRMWAEGIAFMLVFSLLGFVFAAPGAVYIYSPYLTKKENGVISLAGPFTNLALAGIFLALAFVSPLSFGSMNAWLWGSRINIFLALFNLIPIYPLDGSKVMGWNFLIWLLFALISFALFAVV
ncbi:MAG: site-2 protease family protein [Candidatus Micrarchaeota archaeon]